MRNFTRYLSFLTLGVILGTALTLGQTVWADRSVASLPIDELRIFADIFSRIKNNYVEEVEDKELLENAIRGMLSGLDPHSAYLDDEEFRELRVGTSGEFGGLGIEVTMNKDGFVQVVTPIDDTPAKKAGVQAGDEIIRLNDMPVKGMTLSEAVKIMRGKPGSDIKLTIHRKKVDTPVLISITRAIIKVKSVKNTLLDPGFGYVRITNFQSNTGSNVQESIDKLNKENKGKLKGLVLDLRNNPGGVLNAAVRVSDLFLTDGLIVYTQGRVVDSKLSFKADSDDALDGAPIVVLINGGSASASEIVAGALQDHGRAVVMGTKSFGKGSVQTILPLKNNIAVKLTTARYYTPKGTSIQAKGIVPDILLDDYKLEKQEEREIQPLREADLSHHLENTSGKKEQTPAKTASNDKDKRRELLLADYGVHEALNLLKGLYILQASQ